MKTALLICDPTHEDFITAHGNITNLVTELFKNFANRSLLPGLVSQSLHDGIHEFNALGGELPENVAEYNSVIVSGSACGVNDKEPWIQKLTEFLRDTATNHPKVKLIGICFGHQIISNAVFDLPVKANPKGWEIGPYKIDLTETGKVIFMGKESLTIELFHHDAVFSEAPPAPAAPSAPEAPSTPEAPPPPPPETVIRTTKIWGKTEKTDNQGIVSWTGSTLNSVDDIHIFTSQGHPELTQEMTSTLINLFEGKGIEKHAADEARKRVAAFKGDLDQDALALLMWALSTGNGKAFKFSNDS
ncbi:class I glutamine amidotransferase-like protein [Hygrophoropsis aurantiaca]|uniref:Class I glutamine amidotransferase-like protein n=1 Tax=Hygrophoropsis aurantiaca TaxID=72124 RepID=A0ACB7ZZ74_9AGAM|nr:class I glutamine amidotransferase-like protein [Hygrophoropsis aurantiaca]